MGEGEARRRGLLQLVEIRSMKVGETRVRDDHWTANLRQHRASNAIWILLLVSDTCNGEENPFAQGLTPVLICPTLI